MPRGPGGQRRPADTAAAAIKVAKIATGEIEDDLHTAESEGKDPAAVALGRKGGKARASGLSEEKRKEIARKAAEGRWRKPKKI